MRSDRGELPEPGPGRSGTALARRIVPPLLMLLIAGGVFLYAQWQREQRVEDVHTAAEQLCEEVAQMPPGGALPPTARQLQASLTTVEQLQSVLAVDAQLQTLTITIMRGDADPPYGDGSATHQASIEVQGRAAIVLRFLHPGDVQQLRLIGYWTP